MDILKNIRKNKSGFSLVEVLVSIVLIALLATLVAAFLLYWQNVREQSIKITTALNEAQRLMEGKYSDLRKLINNKSEELESLTPITKTIFGQEIPVYTLSAQDAEGKIMLSGGMADTFKENPEIPVIESVNIVTNNNDAVDAMYFTTSTDGVMVKMPIPMVGSYATLKKYLYRWYVGNESFHVLPLAGEKTGEITGVIALCPQDFTLLGLEDKEFLSDVSRFRGKIVACIAIPGTIEGYMGDSVVSNYIYISDLPEIYAGDYVALYDASLISYIDNTADDKYHIDSALETGLLLVDSLASELEYSNSKLLLNHTGNVYLNINGSETQERYGDDYSSEKYPTRFLMYTTGVKSSVSARFGPGTTVYAFAVANDTENTGLPYFFRNDSPMLSNVVIDDEYNESNDNGGWQIRYSSGLVSGDVTFWLGGIDVNIAELILVANPTDEEVGKIRDYLSEKYCITVSQP
jgi:prepilin-type N-terminal cleavage/methylation domain-containing protein